MTTAIYCRNVVKQYGEGSAAVRALRGVDLDVEAGETVMLMGPSGCGKTTLLSVLATLLDASSGTVAIDGLSIDAMGKAERAAFRASRLGFVFQAFNLLPALTAVQNVSVPLRLTGVSRVAAESAARDVLDAVGLDERATHLPSQLSGGQQQRVAIARAIVHQPRILLCDEPTSALDHGSGQQVMTLLRDRACALGAALLVVSHDVRIEAFVDRVIHMEDGRTSTNQQLGPI